MSAAMLDEVTVTSADLELRCLPAHGAKIVSLRWLATGRELLPHRAGRSRPAGNATRGQIMTAVGGTSAGPPSARPTIREGVPDHGDLWRRPWSVSSRARIR
jgi:hypothetical protein